MTGNDQATESVEPDKDLPDIGAEGEQSPSNTSAVEEVETGSDRDGREGEEQRSRAREQQGAQGETSSGVRAGLHSEHDEQPGRSQGRESTRRGSDEEEPSDVAERAEQDANRRPEDALEGVISELSPERREDLQHILFSLVQGSASSWSAPLPEAPDFYKYEPADRERMMRWNDAGTSDESARQDKLVAARIAEATAGPRRAVFVVLVCLALAAVGAFWLRSVAIAGLFLSPPLLMFAQQLAASVIGTNANNDKS